MSCSDLAQDLDVEDNIWRWRTNAELFHVYRDVNIVGYIKVFRQRWAGHVSKMPADQIPKKMKTRYLPEGLEDPS